MEGWIVLRDIVLDVHPQRVNVDFITWIPWEWLSICRWYDLASEEDLTSLAVLTYELISTLVEQVNDFKAAFSSFDRDHDGTITTYELGAVMQALDMHPNEGELKKMIREVDLNMNGKIEFNEFLVLMQKKIHVDGDDELKTEFAAFDKDHSGQISPSELKKVMDGLGERLSDYEIAAMIQEADEDGNGEISFPEFKKMMH